MRCAGRTGSSEQGALHTRLFWAVISTIVGSIRINHLRITVTRGLGTDGQGVFRLDEANGAKLTRVLLKGSKIERVTQLPAASGFGISPDGKLATFPTVPSASSLKVMLALVPTDSPGNMKFLAAQQPIRGLPRLAHDGKAVVYPFPRRQGC